MSKTIQITTALFNRLKVHADGFETPSNVIKKILNSYEKNTLTAQANVYAAKPDMAIWMPPTLLIECYPRDKYFFKTELLKKGTAFVLTVMFNGASEIVEWTPEKFQIGTNLNQYLRSGLLKDWEDMGIVRALLSIDRKHLETVQNEELNDKEGMTCEDCHHCTDTDHSLFCFQDGVDAVPLDSIYFQTWNCKVFSAISDSERQEMKEKQKEYVQNEQDEYHSAMIAIEEEEYEKEVELEQEDENNMIRKDEGLLF